MLLVSSTRLALLSLMVLAMTVATTGTNLRSTRVLQQEDYIKASPSSSGDCSSLPTLPADLKGIPECEAPSKKLEILMADDSIPKYSQMKEWSEMMCVPKCTNAFNTAINSFQSFTSQCASDENKRLSSNGPLADQTFLGRYPGIALGCMRDPTDSVFCATKENGGETRSCAFLTSCCFGELVKASANPPTADQIAQFETMCPGAKAASKKSCPAP